MPTAKPDRDDLTRLADEPVQGQPDRLDDTDTFDIGELWRDVGGSD
jgi:hypothetical protein